jgi:hypothetical protein
MDNCNKYYKYRALARATSHINLDYDWGRMPFYSTEVNDNMKETTNNNKVPKFINKKDDFKE